MVYVINMKFSGFSLFRIRGIEVIIDYSWFVIFFLGIYVLSDIWFPSMYEDYPVHQYWITGTVTVIFERLVSGSHVGAVGNATFAPLWLALVDSDAGGSG